MEAHYPRYLVKVGMLVGIPVLGCFTVYDLIIGRYLVASILALMFLIRVALFIITKQPSYKAQKSQIYTCFMIGTNAKSSPPALPGRVSGVARSQTSAHAMKYGTTVPTG